MLFATMQKKQDRNLAKPITVLFVNFFDMKDYSIIFETTPEPTVLPPSRIANLSPCSIAIGVISLIVILTLSPGITISTPAGSSIVPVTSVVRK